MAQPGSALAWGASGRWFKSSRPDQFLYARTPKSKMTSRAIVPFLALALWASPACPGGRGADPGSLSRLSDQQQGACGSLVATPGQAAARDTLFAAWFTDSRSDSGYNLVEVSASGDSLVLYLQSITGLNPHLRVWGPLTGTAEPGRKRLWRYHRLRMLDPHEIFESATDLTTQGANSRVSEVSPTALSATADSLVCRQTWRSVKATGTWDTLEVRRTVMARRGAPYFVIRYDLTWLGGNPDSVRFIWSNHPRMGAEGSIHDVGFAPGIGLVTTQRVLEARAVGWWALMLDIGNPLAASDTTAGSRTSHLAPDLRADFGSGASGFIGAFVCFNPGREIVPGEFVWADSTGEGETSLDFGSPSASVDTTRVLDSGYRTLICRTPPVGFMPGQTKTLEYAVGRARLEQDALPPVCPEVIWTDGTVSRCPGGTAGEGSSR